VATQPASRRCLTASRRGACWLSWELTDEFDVIATRDDVEHGKPDPEIDLLVARELGVKPEECLVIEDSPAGVQAALAAGMEVIAVTTELTRQKFRDTDLLDRCRVVDDPRMLPTVVRRLIGGIGRKTPGERVGTLEKERT